MVISFIVFPGKKHLPTGKWSRKIIAVLLTFFPKALNLGDTPRDTHHQSPQGWETAGLHAIYVPNHEQSPRSGIGGINHPQMVMIGFITLIINIHLWAASNELLTAADPWKQIQDPDSSLRRVKNHLSQRVMNHHWMWVIIPQPIWSMNIYDLDKFS